MKLKEMNKAGSKYELGFSAGALLSAHFIAVISSGADPQELSQGIAKVDYKLLPVNSENSQKRYLSEVLKRLKNMPHLVFEQYLSLDSKNQRVVEFYAALKNYSILSEFMIEKVREKWLNLDYELTSYDFKSFLLKKLSEADDLDQVSELTTNKLTQVALKMLKELGMFDGKRIKRVEISSQLLGTISDSGDKWFLDAMLLNDEEKRDYM
jgi:hypothetical protein